MELLQAISMKNVFEQENKSHPRSLYLEELLTLVMLNKDATPTSTFQPIRLLDPGCWYKFTDWMTNSADPDQLASKPTDLDLHCLQRQGISGFSRTRVKYESELGWSFMA